MNIAKGGCRGRVALFSAIVTMGMPLLLPRQVSAWEYDTAWIGGGTADWTDSSNWAYQEQDGNGWVIHHDQPSPPSADANVYIDGYDLTPTFQNGPASVKSFNLATTGNATLTVNSGNVLSATSATIGDQTATGVLKVDGAGSSFSATSISVISGGIQVTGGANLAVANLTTSNYHPSTFIVNDPGSQLIINGQFPASDRVDSLFSVSNGGKVIVNNAYGSFNGISVRIDGANSSWTGGAPSRFEALWIDHSASLSTEVVKFGGYQFREQSTAYVINGGVINCKTFVIGADYGEGIVHISGRGTSVTSTENTWMWPTQNSLPNVLSITAGAKFASGHFGNALNSKVYIGIDCNSQLSIDPLVGQVAGHGTTINQGELENRGLIRLTAGTRVAVGDYSPLQFGSLIDGSQDLSSSSGIGEIRAIGGVSDPITHKVHVAYAKAANAGDTVSIDLANAQRIRFTDTATGKTLGVSFVGTNYSQTLTVSASLVSYPASASLSSMIASGNSGHYIDAWAIHPTAGYTQGEDAYLSIEVGANYDIATFKIWHYDGSVWTNYAPDDLSYDGKYVGFTVNGFSSYGLSGGESFSAVPEPASLGLIGLAGLGLLRRKRSA